MKHILGMVGGLLAKKTHAYYVEQANQALAAGNLAGAEKDFAKALSLAEEAKAYDTVALCSKQLGLIAQELGKLAVAEPHLNKAYQTHEDSQQHQEAAECLILLGILYIKQGRLPDAEHVLQYAMSVFQSHCGSRAPGIARAAYLLGDAYVTRQKFAEAEKLLRRSLEIDEANGAGTAEIATKSYKLAAACEGLHDEKGAASAFEKASAAFDKLSDSFDSALAHQACACWHHFGKFLNNQGKTQQAASAFKKALRLADAYPGYLEEAELHQLSKATAG